MQFLVIITGYFKSTAKAHQKHRKVQINYHVFRMSWLTSNKKKFNGLRPFLQNIAAHYLSTIKTLICHSLPFRSFIDLLTDPLSSFIDLPGSPLASSTIQLSPSWPFLSLLMSCSSTRARSLFIHQALSPARLTLHLDFANLSLKRISSL